VLGNPRRFEILQQIAAGQRVGCSTLRTQFPITAATMSHHLKELEAVGLIDTARNGKFVDVTFRRTMWQRLSGRVEQDVKADVSEVVWLVFIVESFCSEGTSIRWLSKY
jgi:ArsR family transcriptional regulator